MGAQEQERKPGKLSGILYRFRPVGFTLIMIAIFFSAFFFIKSSTNSANTFWGAVFLVLAVILAVIQIIPIVFAHKSEPATVFQYFDLSSSSVESASKNSAKRHTFAANKPRTEIGNAAESVFLFNEPHLPSLEDFLEGSASAQSC